MKLNELKEIREYFEPSLYEMSTYLDVTTGLPTGIKLWVRTEPKTLPHRKYRIKISHPQKGDAVFALWGDKIVQLTGSWKVSGDDLSKISILVQLTRDGLINHIDGIIDSLQLGHILLSAKSTVEQS